LAGPWGSTQSTAYPGGAAKRQAATSALLHDEHANANGGYGDHQEPGTERKRDDHSKQRPDDPCDLKLGFETSERCTVVGTGSVALHK